MLITDGNMPEMDGYELTRQIRSIESERGGKHRMPIVACTANVMGAVAELCLAAGMDDYLAKPIELKDLAKTLQRWLPIPSPGADAIDPSVLAAIAAGDKVMEREILVDFHRVNLIDAAALECAVDSSELSDVSRAAHRISGSSKMIGAVELAAVCDRLQFAAESNDWKSIDADMNVFRRELGRLNIHLEERQCIAPT
jgi:HPt (histidine-containing phosphotransfer) domain-containing protein